MLYYWIQSDFYERSIGHLLMAVMPCVSLQDGWTALHAAAKNNNEDVVNMLLMKDPTLTEKSTEVSEQLFILCNTVKQ